MQTLDRLIAIAFLAVFLTAWPSAGQEPFREIPCDPEVAHQPILQYPLGAAGRLLHAQYVGRLRRVDAAGRELANVRVPAADGIASETTVVVAGDLSHALLIHRVDRFKFRQNPRVLLLDIDTLQTRREFPLGDCGVFPLTKEFPAVADRLTMLCYHSRPAQDARRKPTLAVATVDINRGEVIRWSELGGERHGMWFGPLFFGWWYDVNPVIVKHRRACSSSEDVAPDPLQRILVLNRDVESGTGDVWAWSSRIDGPPERLASLSGHPQSAVACASEEGRPVLQVTVDLRTTKEI